MLSCPWALQLFLRHELDLSTSASAICRHALIALYQLRSSVNSRFVQSRSLIFKTFSFTNVLEQASLSINFSHPYIVSLSNPAYVGLSQLLRSARFFPFQYTIKKTCTTFCACFWLMRALTRKKLKIMTNKNLEK